MTDSVAIDGVQPFLEKYDRGGETATPSDGRVDAEEIVRAAPRGQAWQTLVHDLALLPPGREREQALNALQWMTQVDVQALERIGGPAQGRPSTETEETGDAGSKKTAFDALLEAVAQEEGRMAPAAGQKKVPDLDGGTNKLFPGLLARIDHIGRSIHDTLAATRVAQGIQKIADTKVAPALNATMDAVEVGVDAVGSFFDGVEEAAAKAGARVAKAGADRLAWAEETAAKLRASADELSRWVHEVEEAQTAGVSTGETTSRDVRNAKATAVALKAVADHIDIMRSHRKGRRALATGKAIALRVLAEGVDLVGRLSKVTADGAAALITLAGRVFGWALGSDTLRNTAVSLGAGISVGLGTKKINAGVGAALFFPSMDIADEAGSYYDGMYFNWGFDANTSALSLSWSERTSAGTSFNLYFVSGNFTDKSQSIFVGIPGVFGISVGRDVKRGAYTSWGTAIPIPGGPFYVGTGVTVYSPLLMPLAKATRPIAKVITKTSETIVKGMRAAWRGISSIFHKDEPGTTSSSTEPPDALPDETTDESAGERPKDAEAHGVS